MTSPLLTTKQAAEYLSMSPKTLRQKAKIGEIAYIEHNQRCWSFLIKDLDSYIAKHRIQEAF